MKPSSENCPGRAGSRLRLPSNDAVPGAGHLRRLCKVTSSRSRSSAQEVGDNPLLLSQLDRIDAEREQLAAAKSTSDQHGEDCVVSFATQ